MAVQSPMQLDGKRKRAALKNVWRAFKADNGSDYAAALTYYGLLAIFPGLLVFVAILGLLGPDRTNEAINQVGQVAPAEVVNFVNQIVATAQQQQTTAGVVAIIALLVALWSASGYISAFMRASNVIYQVPEGRPIWKTIPIRLVVTVVVAVMLVAAALIIILSGNVATAVGHFLNLSDAAITTWNIAKWPVLAVLAAAIVAVIYWAAPNVKPEGWRWISPGSAFAIVIWLIASAGFAFYAANFASYNRTYGTLAGVIIFLVWFWISNTALLFGLALNAELARERALQAGLPEDAKPYVRLQDTAKLTADEQAAAARVEEVLAQADADDSPSDYPQSARTNNQESPMKLSSSAGTGSSDDKPNGNKPNNTTNTDSDPEEKEMPNAVTRIGPPLVAFALTFTARKVAEKVYKKRTGHTPPDPQNLRDPLGPTVAWAVATAALTTAITVVVQRHAAKSQARALGAVPVVDLRDKPTPKAPDQAFVPTGTVR